MIKRHLHLIGLTGYARSGKDSAYSYLEPMGYKRFAFADALRQMARGTNAYISMEGAPLCVRRHFTTHLGLPRKFVRYAEIIDTIGYEAAKLIPDFRAYLQSMGTEGVRSVFGEDAWVDALDHVLENQQFGAKACITDVRFPNEADYVHSQGGTVWRIIRVNEDGSHYDAGVDRSHGSERHIANLPADYELVASNLSELAEQVVGAYEDMYDLHNRA